MISENWGYIFEKDNIIFACLMDAGKMLGTKISGIEIKGTFHKCIGIYLVDSDSSFLYNSI